jgi:hypothetical protein
MRWVLLVVGFSFLAAAPKQVAAVDARQSEAEKAAGEWMYPKAKVSSNGRAGAIYLVVQDSTDSVEKILKYYGDKLGVQLLQGTGSGSKKDYVPKEGMEYVSYRTSAGANIVTIKTSTACVNLVIQRPRGGSATSIAITYAELGK